jgi:predicted RNase H-like HicB family nuclease
MGKQHKIKVCNEDQKHLEILTNMFNKRSVAGGELAHWDSTAVAQWLLIRALEMAFDPANMELIFQPSEAIMHQRPELQHLLSKVRDVLDGDQQAWSVQSTGERLAVALVLNRVDWLHAMDYSVAAAIDRIGLSWTSLIPAVAKIIAKERSEKDSSTGTYEFPACFELHAEGSYTVTMRDLAELVTEGDSFDEAMANAVEALALVIEQRQAEKICIPKASELLDGESLVSYNVKRLGCVVDGKSDVI